MGYAPGGFLAILGLLAFVPACVICYAVVLRKNAKRDIDHQIPILKAFLYAIIWTPLIVTCIWLVLNLFN